MGKRRLKLWEARGTTPYGSREYVRVRARNRTEAHKKVNLSSHRLDIINSLREVHEE